jgi:hypothetical protein
MWTTERQNRHQLERDRAAADRDYAWRADEHFRPYVDQLLAATRTINEACAAWATNIGDMVTLDQCVDHLACSAMTRDVASSATQMREKAVEYYAALRVQEQLTQQMPRAGEPLRPDVGRRVAEAHDRASDVRDEVLGATLDVRNAVNRLTAELEARQRGAARSTS